MIQSRQILLVEDNAEIADLIALHLGDAGHAVTVKADGGDGLKAALKGQFDLIVLDLMIPTMDGLEVCRQLRQRGDYVPILMLTAKSSETDRVVGLEIGADDYLSKPFSMHELLARVKALFRRVEAMRRQQGPENLILRHDGLEIDAGRRTVVVSGQQVSLTAREFELLLFFARHPGHVFNRAQLLEHVWGHSYAGFEHTVNSHINRLRAKIEREPSAPKILLTVWGVGYRFAERENTAVHENA